MRDAREIEKFVTRGVRRILDGAPLAAGARRTSRGR